MEEQKMRALAIEAAKRFSDEINSRAPELKIEGLTSGEFALKVKGVYRRPLTKDWQIHFDYFQIRYVPDRDASDEAHIGKIVELLRLERSLP